MGKVAIQPLSNKDLYVNEIISTSMTTNYIPYWNCYQAIKEGIQNLVYGATKSGEPLKTSHDGQVGVVEDSYIGFPKKYLYLGESHQRDDDEGLGLFGEGWKLFLLIMAREGKRHRVSTVGYDFWGEIQETEHETEVLEIVTVPNNRTSGTKLELECSKEEFNKALDAFLYTQERGLQISRTGGKNAILQGVSGIYINGVKIENKDGECPLDLEFAYSIFSNEKMMNRDRTEVNHQRVLNAISNTIFQEATEDFARDFVQKSMDISDQRDYLKEDIQRGPYFLNSCEEQVQMWKKIIRDLHQAPCDENLLLPSNDIEINRSVLYKGFTLLTLPRGWKSDLQYLGYKTAEDKLERKVIKKPILEENLSVVGLENLRLAKMKLRRAFRFPTIKDFPTIQVAEELKIPFSEVNIEGLYCEEKEEVWLNYKMLEDFSQTLKTLLHELVHWKFKVDDNTKEQVKVYENIILDLLNR